MPVGRALDNNADQPDPDPELWGQQEWRRRRTQVPEWQTGSLCAQYPPEIFFGSEDTSERPALSMSDVAKAREICARCPAFRACITHALGADAEGVREEYGIWAGTTGRMRRRIWAMVDRDEVSLAEVVEDICAGNTQRYERKRSVTVTPLVLTLSEAEAIGA